MGIPIPGKDGLYIDTDPDPAQGFCSLNGKMSYHQILLVPVHVPTWDLETSQYVKLRRFTWCWFSYDTGTEWYGSRFYVSHRFIAAAGCDALPL